MENNGSSGEPILVTTGWEPLPDRGAWLRVDLVSRKEYRVHVEPSEQSPAIDGPHSLAPRQAREKALAVAMQAISGVRQVKKGFTFWTSRFTKNAERLRRMHADPAFKEKQAKAASENMRRMHADPAFKEKNAERLRRMHADPAFNPLAALTAEQREEYDLLVKKGGYSREEALATVRGEIASAPVPKPSPAAPPAKLPFMNFADDNILSPRR